jgi:putative ABC transport system permease protein
MNSGLLRFSIKHLGIRWDRSLLTVLSVVLGVAAIGAVEMTAEATRHAYQAMFSTVTGKAELEVTGASGTAFDRTLVDELRAVPGVKAAVPQLFNPVRINTRRVTKSVEEETDSTENDSNVGGARSSNVYVLGVDPAVDEKLRDYKLKSGRKIENDWEMLLEENIAEALPAKVGDELSILAPVGFMNGGLPRVTVVGITKSTQSGGSMQGGLAMVNLQTAQRLFLTRRGGTVPVLDPDDEEEEYLPPLVDKIHSIQIIRDEKVPLETLQTAIAAKVPEGVTVAPPASRTQALDATMKGTQQGLQVTTRFSLMLGAFIIFNTMLMNVSERRKQIAIVRAIGATRSQVWWMVLRESLLIGVVGSAIGLVVGYVAARFITGMLAHVTQVDIPLAQLTPWITFLSVAFGLGMAVIGSVLPAWTAAGLSPQESMSAIVRAPGGSDSSSRFTMWGLVLGAAGGLWLFLCIMGVFSMDYAVYGGMATVLSALLLLHIAMDPLSALASAAMRPFMGISATLAHRQLMRNRSRTSITAGVLFIACATGVGMAHTILDSVADVRSWYNKVLTGDFFIRTMVPDPATGLVAPLPPEIVPEIKKIGGIKGIDTALFQPIKAKRPTAPNAAPDAAPVMEEIFLVARDLPEGIPMNLDVVAGSDPEIQGEALRQRLLSGEVALGSVYAAQVKLKQGDYVEIDTPTGLQKLRVAAVVNDYLSGGLTIWMSRNTAAEVLGVTGVGAVIVYAEPGKMDEVRSALKPLCARYGILLHSFADVKQVVEEIIGGTDKCLWALIYLGFFVAAFGMINTLSMNVIEQTREIGMLRTIAMTRGQVFRGIRAQALIMSLIGLVPGILVGLGVTYLLNIAAQVSLAHDIVYHSRPGLAFMTFGGALLLIMVAAFFPANRAAKLPISQALQCE